MKFGLRDHRGGARASARETVDCVAAVVETKRRVNYQQSI